MKKHIPNALTCLNLICGCLAVFAIFDNRLERSAYLVFIAAFFDLLDGMAARLLRVSSSIGKQLDSLADVISFGLVPGLLMCTLLKQSDATMAGNYLWLLPLIITVCSALRLAKFNIDTRQTDSFLGLPTPANAILIASFPLLKAYDTFGLADLILNPYFLLIISVVLSLLLVSEIPLFGLKFKNASWEDNAYQYSLLVISVTLLSVLQFAALPVIIFFYVLLSLIKNYRSRNTV